MRMKVNLTYFIRNTLLAFYNNENDKENYNSNIENIGKINTIIELPCRIKMVIQENYGKVVENEESTVIMEGGLFYKHLAQYIPNDILTEFPDYQSRIGAIDSNDYGNELLITFPSNRINAYIESDYDNLVEKGVVLANSFVVKMGSFNHLNIHMPLIMRMEQFALGSVLMNLIMTLIIFALFLLSIILIYSLLTITMETNSFEFGILRLIGTTNANVIMLILFQCLIFALPAFILAFAWYFIVLKIMNNVIASFVHTDLKMTFDGVAFAIAILATSLGPITASILPIRTILKKKISISLNTMLNKTSAIKVEIVSLARNEVISMVIFGMATFLYGLSIHYFPPLSLVSFNLSLLGMIFIMILIGILVGAVILSMNIENILQKGITYTLLVFTRSYIKNLIIKNLTAHRLKNRKTSIMYSLSVGLFIMASVVLDIVIQSIQMQSLLNRGSEILLTSDKRLLPGVFKNSLRKMFEKGLIESFAFKSHTMDDICDCTSSIKNLGGFLKYEVNLIGVSPTFFNMTDRDFLKIGETRLFDKEEYNEMVPTEQLYLKGNMNKLGLSGYFTNEFNLKMNDAIYL